MNNLVRTPEELGLMRKSGEITALALKKTIESVRVGMTLLELEKIATDEIERLGAKSSFKSVPGYHFTTCLNVNDEVVHGLPREIILEDGDVLKIDLGALYKGWHTDAAWTIPVGQIKSDKSEEIRKFLAVGEEAMWAAVKQAKSGSRIGDISNAMQSIIERAGFNVVMGLAGHGVGRAGHEEPEVPTFGEAGRGLKLEAGMTLAIEAIYAAGEGDIYTLDDGWTIATEDGSMAGLFEMTVIVGDNPEVITDWRKV